jgi:GNAT superfamily N-acetyltransferase
MAASEALAIERLGCADVAAGLALSAAAGWNQTADDWLFFLAAGDVRGVRDDNGTVVATAAALPYDDASGWISMVLVDPAHRHRGIASQLVEACVTTLRSAGRTPVLDATPAGAAVYARSGFVAGFAFERWEGEGGGDPDASAASAPAATIASTLSALDRDAGGVDRGALWNSVLARAGTRAILAPGGDGFAVRRAGHRATQVGPIVAASPAAARDLLTQVLDDVGGEVFIDVPARSADIHRELERRGFVRQRPFVRMASGDARAAAERERVFALAGPEFG